MKFTRCSSGLDIENSKIWLIPSLNESVAEDSPSCRKNSGQTCFCLFLSVFTSLVYSPLWGRKMVNKINCLWISLSRQLRQWEARIMDESLPNFRHDYANSCWLRLGWRMHLYIAVQMHRYHFRFVLKKTGFLAQTYDVTWGRKPKTRRTSCWNHQLSSDVIYYEFTAWACCTGLLHGLAAWACCMAL